MKRICIADGGGGGIGEGGSSQPKDGPSKLGYVELTPEEYARNFGHHLNGDDEHVSDHMGDTNVEAEMEERVGEDVEMGGKDMRMELDDLLREEDVASTIVVKRGSTRRNLKSSEESSSMTMQRIRKRKENEEWLVKEPVDGGPVISDLIPSFGAHVARVLWSNPSARGLLTPMAREQALLDLRNWELPRGASQKINASGLQHLVSCMHHFLDVPLLTAFIERWQPDTNTFHLPFGEMTITLHDVQQILRIPIEGNACRVSQTDVKHPIISASEFLSLRKDELQSHWDDHKKDPIYLSGGLLHEAIQMKCQQMITDEAHSQGWLMVLLGSTLFADKTGDRVKANMFPLIRDVDHVGEYAWGAAALAYLYRQLGVATRANCKQVCGCLTLLQSWIYEHFSCFRPHEMFDHPVVVGAPRSLLWRTPFTKQDVGRLKYIRQKMDMLDPSLVTWLPYSNNPGESYPNSLYSGFIRFLDIVEPYQPERSLRQFGYRQIIPRPISQPDYHYRPRDSISYDVRYGNSADDSWYATEDHRIRLQHRSIPAMPCYAAINGYMEWYRARTHPFLVAVNTLPQELYKDRTMTESELCERIICAFGNVYFSEPEEFMDNLKAFYDDMLPVFMPFLTRDLGRGGPGPSRGCIKRGIGRRGTGGRSKGGLRGGERGSGNGVGGDF